MFLLSYACINCYIGCNYYLLQSDTSVSASRPKGGNNILLDTLMMSTRIRSITTYRIVLFSSDAVLLLYIHYYAATVMMTLLLASAEAALMVYVVIVTVY